MLTSARRIFRAGIQHHRADVPEGAPAELADEVAVNPALVGFVVPTIRIVRTGIQRKRTEVIVLEPAMDTVERPFLVALKERMFAAPVGMMQTRIRQQRPRVVVLLPAVFAVFAHATILTCLP